MKYSLTLIVLVILILVYRLERIVTVHLNTQLSTYFCV